jgi:hypothetical protein
MLECSRPDDPYFISRVKQLRRLLQLHLAPQLMTLPDLDTPPIAATHARSAPAKPPRWMRFVIAPLRADACLQALPEAARWRALQARPARAQQHRNTVLAMRARPSPCSVPPAGHHAVPAAPSSQAACCAS